MAWVFPLARLLTVFTDASRRIREFPTISL
ncbi:Uncharacterised protein [Mycobacteroides abscessus subsp. abscessus]|nr:Uncharacterised protein [Mycobacteroides abscessus subsp. abscessus]